MSRRATDTAELTQLLVEHSFDGETYPPTGQVWVACSCSRTDMYGGDDAWPVEPINRSEATALHAAHQAQVIAEWVDSRNATMNGAARC